MTVNLASPEFRIALAMLALAVPTGCTRPGAGPQVPRMAVSPVCAINWVSLFDSPELNSPTTTWRRDTSVDHGFERPRNPTGVGLGDGIIGRDNVVAFDEAWFRHPLAPQMVIAQVTNVRRGGSRVADEYFWSINTQDATGAIATVIAAGRSKPAGQSETRDAAAATLPRLMPVGVASPQMFACVDGLSDDGAEPTTRLVEITPPGQSAAPGVVDIQDLVYGDTRFVPNAPGPLRGPANPPAPRITTPGGPVSPGLVQCAMIQRDDDVTTRELHMLDVRNGVLRHSMASNFSNAVSNGGNGFAFTRFNNVQPWGDVAQVLGIPGQVTSAAVVPARPRGISVYFTVTNNGVQRLFHAMRFSDSNSWSAVDDVLAISGDAPNGNSNSIFRVQANICPPQGAVAWTNENTEQLITLQGDLSPYQLMIIRRVPRAEIWRPGVSGVYSPWRSVRLFQGSAADGQQRNVRIPFVRVTGRAFDRTSPSSPP